MLDIYRVDHVSQAVPALEPQLELMQRLFGFQTLRTWTSDEEGCHGARLAVGPGEHWEILAPHGEDSPIQAFLDARGGRGGLHHVGVEVPDLDAARRELDARGIEPTLSSSEGWIEASLTPPEAGTGVRFRINGPGEHTVCGDDPKGPTIPGGRLAQEGSLAIVGIDHVCQAFADRDELARWYRDLAGFVEVWRTPEDEHEDMADLVLNVPGSRMCWEVIMPRGEESFIDRFLERSGPSVHHVTFEVADWGDAMAACEKHGVEPFGDNSGETDGARWNDAFLHPKQTGGVLVQLFAEQRPGVWVRSDKIPPRG